MAEIIVNCEISIVIFLLIKDFQTRSFLVHSFFNAARLCLNRQNLQMSEFVSYFKCAFNSLPHKLSKIMCSQFEELHKLFFFFCQKRQMNV